CRRARLPVRFLPSGLSPSVPEFHRVGRRLAREGAGSRTVTAGSDFHRAPERTTRSRVEIHPGWSCRPTQGCVPVITAHRFRTGGRMAWVFGGRLPTATNGRDRKSTRLNSRSRENIVCRLPLETKKEQQA